MYRLLTYFVLVLLTLNACVSEPEHEKLDFRPVITDVGDAENPTIEVNQEGEFSDLLSDYENQDREYWQKPNEVIRSLGDLSNKVVADIGAGTGYFTFRILPKAKKVIAIDIDDRMTKFVEELKEDLDTEFADKLDVRLATTTDPKLDFKEADIIFLSNTYAYIGNRTNYFRQLATKFNDGGKLVVVDFKKKIVPVHPDQDDRVPLYQVEQELISAGYTITKSDDRSLPYQYILEAQVDVEGLK